MDVGSAVRGVIDRVLPQSVHPMFWVKRKVREGTDWQVESGPFRGLKYVRRAIGSALYPKLLGTYERELHGVMEEILRLKPKDAIVIGAGEGYYAVGMPFAGHCERVTAYEADANSRPHLERLAELNGVADRIVLHGPCDVDGLNAALANAPMPVLVLCDVEGYEDVLLDPVKVPGLKHAHVLVETHDFAKAGLTNGLKARFAPSHEIVEIFEQKRSPDENPHRDLYTKLMPHYYQMLVVGEGRPPGNNWLWMKPLA